MEVFVDVVDAHGSGDGVNPTWYLIFLSPQKLFERLLTQSVIAWFCFCCFSCCLIVDDTCFSGVVERGCTPETGSITNQPYCAL